MNQTAVEWLIEQMFKQGYFDGNKPLSITNLDHLQHQAKEMEKKQIEISDEEIEAAIHKIYGRDCEDFYSGAIWYREQLKQR